MESLLARPAARGDYCPLLVSYPGALTVAAGALMVTDGALWYHTGVALERPASG
jgi:hypothetical protein